VRRSVAHDRLDTGGAILAPASQGRIGQFAEKTAPGSAATGRLGVEIGEKVVGKGDHDLGHGRESIPGIAEVLAR
jgi:hypothetical protein